MNARPHRIAACSPEGATFATGTAKRYWPDRGYGFVVVPGEDRDIFLHFTVLKAGGFAAPAPGSVVELEYWGTNRGLQAVRVISIQHAAAPTAVPPADEVYPARMKFYDKKGGYGFVNVYGAPDVDIHVPGELFQWWGLLPIPGEAVAVHLGGSDGRSAQAIFPWDLCVGSEASHG